MVAWTTRLRDAFTAKRTCMTAFRPCSLNVTLLFTQQTGLTELFLSVCNIEPHAFGARESTFLHARIYVKVFNCI